MKQDGVDVWDISRNETIATVRDIKTSGREPASVISAIGWASADRPVIVTADGLCFIFALCVCVAIIKSWWLLVGVVRVYDMLLHTATSPLLAQVFDIDILGPHTAETKVAQVAKALLQHQPFNGFSSVFPNSN